MTNQSNVAGKSSIKAILTTVIAILLIVSTFTSTAFADTLNQYDVKIVDNGEEFTVTTTETEPIEILNTAGITLSSDDKMDITSFDEGEGGTIIINRLNSINVEFDGAIHTYSVYSSTVGEALDEIGVTVGQNDKVSYDLNDTVQNGMVISIRAAFSVSLTADGKTAEYAIANGTVADLLNLAGIQLGADDYTKPDASSALKAGMKVTVYRVEYKTETKTETIKYSTTQKKDKSLAQGRTKVITKGVDGSKDVTYKVKYINGKEESRETLSEVVVTEPTNKVVKIGTKKTKGSSTVKPNGVTSKNGYTVGQVISGRYTHYCACAKCNGNSRGVTSSGKKISNGMANPYYVACNWLPLGSVINVDGTNYTVVDRGGSGLSREGRIDIFTPEGHDACYRYGTGSCTITIVRLGW
ncbi:MAG: ubiquitin-like domain-containing protein [Eubacterium sp.]